jgi:hypothetical protein
MTEPSPRGPAARVGGLRANALAAVVMLLVQYCLGMWVALYGALPAGDLGKSLFSAFGAAVGNGPVILGLHAILGTLLLVTATVALVRSSRLGSVAAIALTAVGLLTIVVAWVSGSKFVGAPSSETSFTMAIATAAATLSYAIVIFLLGEQWARPRAEGDRQGPARGANRPPMHGELVACLERPQTHFPVAHVAEPISS